MLNSNPRSLKARKNVFKLVFLRGYALILSFLIVPKLLGVLGDYKYGVWITVFSILSWVNLLDIGIGNGLRNKLTIAVANHKTDEAKALVSTAYFSLGTIILIFCLLFLFPLKFVEWESVLNIQENLNIDALTLVGVCVIMSAIQLGLRLINTIFLALQFPVIPDMINVISNTIILFALFVFDDFFSGNLIKIGVLFTFTPMCILSVASVIFFKRSHQSITPSITCYDPSLVKSIFNLGIQYFMIQISLIIILQTDSLIISNVMSPDKVTPYNILFKYFSIITVAMSVLMTPLWGAYTEAVANDDLKWVRTSVKKQLLIIPIAVVIIIAMIYSFEFISLIWLGKEFEEIGLPLLLLFGLQSVFIVLNNITSTILNALSKVRLSMFLVMISAILNIPLSVYFSSTLQMGLNGIILGTLCSGVLVTLISPIQCYYFVFSKKTIPLLEKLLK